MKNITIKYLILIIGLISTTGCKDLLNVDPEMSIDAGNALTSVEGFQTATTGVYSVLRETAQYGRALIVYPEIMSNTAAQSGRTSTLLEMSNNATGQHLSTWQTGYKAILQINVILDALENFPADQDWKNGIAGQLHFLRALFFHNMAKVYGYDPTAIHSSNRGTVPLNLKGVLSIAEIENLERATIPAMYAQLYKDLEKAYELLENTPAARAPHYVTKGAVAAFFSRVALYNGDYDRVIEEADKAIASGVGRLSTRTSYVADWRTAIHPESMFEVEFKVDQVIGVTDAIRSAFTTRVNQEATISNGNGSATVSDQLYALYEDNDVRRTLIMKGLGNATNANEMTKFFSRGGTPNLDNVPVIRLSEVYLNRAEAYARTQGMSSQALQDVNRIRERAGLSPVSGLVEDNLIAEVLKQRKLELAFEGHSFFDYKRLGMDIVKPNGNIFRFTDFRVLARIPWREFNANKNLTQNRGY